MRSTTITRLFIFLLSLSGFSPTLTAQAPVAVKEITQNKKVSEQKAIIGSAVNKAVESFMAKNQPVGMSLGIYKDGKFYTYNYGLVEKGTRKHPTSHSLYEIASITKTFAGTLLAQAMIEKKVNLDDDIRKYLDGSFPNLEYQGQPIRLFHLLNHRSGLPNWLPDTPGIMPGSDKPAEWTNAKIAEVLKDYTREDFYRDLHKVKIESAPGQNAFYSNAAAQLLGYILERVYNKSFEDLVKMKITKPLGMNDTTITLSNPKKKRLVKGYDYEGVFMPYTPDKVQAAGSLKSTVADMLKYIQWHVSEKDEAVKLTHQPTWSAADMNYSAGLNWQMFKSAEGNRLIWQNGNLAGFTSLCAFYPELKFGIVVLMNKQRTNLTNMTTQIMQAIDSRSVAFP